MAHSAQNHATRTGGRYFRGTTDQRRIAGFRFRAPLTETVAAVGAALD